MKLSFVILFSVLSSLLFSQKNIGGLYTDENHSRVFDIKPNHTYTYTWYSPCGVTPNFSSSGKWYNINDTLFLSSEKDTTSMKFLLNYQYNLIEKDKVFHDTIDLLVFPKIDSIIPHNWLDIRDLLMFVRQGHYTKEKSYFDNGFIEYTKESNSHLKRRVESYYYINGHLKELRQFYKNKKTGDWYFYNENGSILKVQRYRRGRLKKEIINYS